MKGVPAPRPPESLQTQSRRQWSTEDDQYLRDHITTQGYEEIALHLGRSIRAIYKRRDILGLTVVRKSHRVAKPWKIQ